MNNRRDFIKQAMLLSGATAWQGFFPESIAAAAAIDPAPGSTFADAEHVVILMQENRSFDHCFGMLKGVRGFNDPRFIHLPDGRPVWLQTNAAGQTYAPFPFDIRGTKVTWMGSTPHSRSSQLDAYNDGRYDRWLDVKKVNHKGAENMPMTLGYYTREDVPFNYALADAFTICDQNFCSAMTSTWPNRLYLWSGTIREAQRRDAKAYIRNEIPWGEARWTTFPEILEKNGVSWKVYQNDITEGGGFEKAARPWLSNFGCNPLEYLAQYNVRFTPRYVAGLEAQVAGLPGEIEQLKASVAAPLPEAGDTDVTKKAYEKACSAQDKARKSIVKKEEVLSNAQRELQQWNRENFEKLSPEARNIHTKAFTINDGDPDYHQLTPLAYEVDGEKRELHVPKGDVLHQFRQDVNEGRLPAVSWLVGPASFTDHPAYPWFGSWYVSEVMDILTKNPEVWKKTVFIMTYDENDGYFDHVPPFVAPDPARPETGRCSAGIDTGGEHIDHEQELSHGVAAKEARGGPIGLGYRVPMIIASPWTRGGRVCSQVFDHTSVFRFVQDWHQKKTGRHLVEDTISPWRKAVAGDLTSAFRPFNPGEADKLSPLERTVFMKGIYDAKFKPMPANYQALTAEQIAETTRDPRSSPHLPRQEPGVKPSCALPYELHAEGRLSADRKSIEIKMEARKDAFGERAAGSPFNIHLARKYAGADGAFVHAGSRSYAVAAGAEVVDSWPVAGFEGGLYHLRLHGPNGFFRECRGGQDDPAVTIECAYEKDSAKAGSLSGRLELRVAHAEKKAFVVTIRDHAYGGGGEHTVPAGSHRIVLDPAKSFGWYDFSVVVRGFDAFERRYAGRVETGRESFSDPYMGRMV